MHTRKMQKSRWTTGLALAMVLAVPPALADPPKPTPAPKKQPVPTIDPTNPIPWMATPPRAATPTDTRNPPSNRDAKASVAKNTVPSAKKTATADRAQPPATKKQRPFVRAVFGSDDAPQLDP